VILLRPLDNFVEHFYGVRNQSFDGYFPFIDKMGDEIDLLEDEVVENANPQLLDRLFQLKRALITARRASAPVREIFNQLTNRDLALIDRDEVIYFRDVYDHLIRISDLIDSYRDLLTGAMDVYLSTVSNRLNSVMKQLTVIATIFLPLTFITGFFGQNFGWMVGNIGGAPEFLAFGVGSEIVIVVGLLALFKRRGWF
jgi:magnesium transporter